MTGNGRRRLRCRWRAPARLAAASALLMLPVLGGPPAAAEPAPEQGAAVLTLTGLEPRAPVRSDVIVLRGEVRAGDVGIRNPRVRLRVSDQPVSSRSDLAAQAGSTESFGSPVNAPGASVDLPDLAAGGRAAFTLKAPMAALRLTRLGVYPFGVDLRGVGGDGTETLARLRTWLPYGATAPASRAGLRPTSIAWLWPLVDLPDRNPDGSFPTDALAASLRPAGRLGRILGAARPATPRGPPVPVTFAIDPALLEAAAAMGDGYLVRRPGGRAVPGTGVASATAFLRQLEQLTALNPVLALPYADPDLTALVRAGRAVDVGVATGSPTFRQLVQRVLGTAPLERIAWPPGGVAPQSTLDALTGVDTVVLSGTGLPALRSLSYTPDAVATLPAVGGGTLRALVSDPTLDSLVAAAPSRAGSVRQAEQRFLAETLLITVEQPSVSRSVVVAPPRDWAPPPGWAAALLQDSARVPWLRPIRLQDLRAQPGTATRGQLVYPAAAQQAELPPSLFDAPGGVRQLAARLDAFEAIVTNPASAGVPALDRALLRCESAAWRTKPAAGRALRVETAKALKTLTNKVRITSAGTVSLASNKNSIPISVANDLGQPVRIQVALSSTAARLIAEDSGVKTIAGGHQLQLSVGLQAPGSGVFLVTARLLTPGGQPYGTTEDLRVYSSRYGPLALAITGGAFAILVLIAAVRLGRRLKASGRAEPAPSP